MLTIIMKKISTNVKVDFRLSQEAYTILQKHAKQKFLKVSPLCRVIIMEYLQEQGLVKQ